MSTTTDTDTVTLANLAERLDDLTRLVQDQTDETDAQLWKIGRATVHRDLAVADHLDRIERKLDDARRAILDTARVTLTMHGLRDENDHPEHPTLSTFGRELGRSGARTLNRLYREVMGGDPVDDATSDERGDLDYNRVFGEDTIDPSRRLKDAQQVADAIRRLALIPIQEDPSR